MPNGYELSDEEFRRQESLLRRFDEQIMRCALDIRGEITRQYHGYPTRWIAVRQGQGPHKRIDFGLITGGEGASSTQPHYHLSIVAFLDMPTCRFAWHETLARGPIALLNAQHLSELLKQAWERLAPIDTAFLTKHGVQSPLIQATSSPQTKLRPGEYLN